MKASGFLVTGGVLVSIGGTDSAEIVAAAMRRTPVTDFVNKDTRIRAAPHARGLSH